MFYQSIQKIQDEKRKTKKKLKNLKMAHYRSPYYIKDIGENNPFRDIYRFREDYSSQ